MKHQYIVSKDKLGVCNVCDRDLLSHTNVATCDLCHNKSSCDIFITTNELLCNVCADKKRAEVLISIGNAQAVKNLADVPQDIREAAKVIEKEVEVNTLESRLTNELTRINGSSDFFNAQVMLLAEIKQNVYSADDMSEQQKHEKFFSLVKERYTHFKDRVFALNNELMQANAGVLAATKLINEFGAEAREELRKLDEKYQPEKPKVVKPKLSPGKKINNALDYVYQVIMDTHNCNREKAIEIYRTAATQKAKEEIEKKNVTTS